MTRKTEIGRCERGGWADKIDGGKKNGTLKNGGDEKWGGQFKNKTELWILPLLNLWAAKR